MSRCLALKFIIYYRAMLDNIKVEMLALPFWINGYTDYRKYILYINRNKDREIQETTIIHEILHHIIHKEGMAMKPIVEEILVKEATYLIEHLYLFHIDISTII